MEKFSTLKTDLLELWLDNELKEVSTQCQDIPKEPSKENIDFLKQFAAGYFPVMQDEVEIELMLN
jgi:hypothetical protein